MKTVHWILFAAMVLAQLAVPAYMIATHEDTLQGGVAYKFRCGPVDPYDYFRGRYVALSFPGLNIADWKGESFERGDAAYGWLAVDDAGFATIENVTRTPPANRDYLPVTAWTGTGPSGTLWLRLPFDRYYMNELDAPAAEIAYREQSRTEDGAHVVIRVKDGEGIIEGLYFGDETVEDFLRREMAAGAE